MRLLPLAALVTLAACSNDGQPSKATLCKAADSVGEKFGTISDLGPCVGEVHSRSAFMNASSVLFTHTVSGRNVSVSWVGDEIVGISY